MSPRRVLAVAGTLMLVASSAQAQDAYKVIVNSANRVSTISSAQLSRFFLEPATWDDGQAVMPVDMSVDSPVRQRFSKDVHGISPASANDRWRAVITAGGKPPLVVATDADVIQYVRLKLGAVGYVSESADVSAVKVVSIERVASTAPSAAGHDSSIRKVLAGYTSALEARDVDALKRLWPTVSAAQERAIRAEFGHTRALRVELLDPQIDVRDDQATVTVRRRYVLTTTEGTNLQSETSTTVNLRHAASGWLIQDIRFRAGQ